MISGSKIRFDWLCRSLLLALAFCAAPAWAFDLPDLMVLLAKQKSGRPASPSSVSCTASKARSMRAAR